MAQLHTYIHTIILTSSTSFLMFGFKSEHNTSVKEYLLEKKILFLATAVSIVLASQGSRVTHSATKLTNWLRSIASFVCNDFCTYTYIHTYIHTYMFQIR